MTTATCTLLCFFFFNDTATTEIYTLSLHDALPISARAVGLGRCRLRRHSGSDQRHHRLFGQTALVSARSEEHTSELQSQSNLVCRLLLEKKKDKTATCPGWVPVAAASTWAIVQRAG